MRQRLVRAFAAVAGLAVVAVAPLAGRAEDPPQTGFERNGGAAWTSHDEESEFLAAVDAASDRVEIDVIGTTEEGRPLHLVRLGHPRPRSAAAARTAPVQLHVCTQHGNEPAGREACLQVLRDLAFATDPELVGQLATTTILFVPTANPDGRDRNRRGNAAGVDVNRDHLNLETAEAQAIARVVRDWAPDLVLDHHEYGPGTPVLYDDEVLYLWPRNLNVDAELRALGKSFSQEHLAPCLEALGYSSDEYGVDSAGPVDVRQTAGDGDEGIARNAVGLRHAVGILIESGVTQNLVNGPGELMTADNQKRRVASHVATIGCALDWMRAAAADVAAAQQRSIARKVAEGRDGSAPVYFQGQDEDTTLLRDAPPTESGDPPCAYDLTPTQAADLAAVLDLHGIASQRRDGGVRVSMAQPAEPVIPLLLDARNDDRAATEGEPVERCDPGARRPVRRDGPVASPPGAAQPRRGRLPATGGAAGLGLLALGSAGVGLALARARG